MTTNTTHSPELRELANRLFKLSYRDMTTFAGLFGHHLRQPNGRGDPVAQALLDAGHAIHTGVTLPPAQEPVPHWASSKPFHAVTLRDMQARDLTEAPHAGVA